MGMRRRVLERLASEFQRGREKGQFPRDPKEALQLQIVVILGKPVGLRAREERLCHAQT